MSRLRSPRKPVPNSLLQPQFARAIGDVRGYKCSVDYCSVLRVPKNADRLVIKASYRQLARDLHPDKKDGCLKATEKMMKINAAHDVLTDSEKKKAYDTARSKHVAGRACHCQIRCEESDIWSQPEKSLVKAKSSITCHCENCDPVTKALKEKARMEAERARQEKKENEIAEKQRLDLERKEKECAQAERMEQERRERERLEAERIQQEREKQQQERERAEQEQAERLVKAKLERKRRILEQFEQEHSRREKKRVTQVEKLRLEIEQRQRLRRTVAVAGPSRTPEGTTSTSAREPAYSTYWINDNTMTPYFRSIREDFDRAMRLHKHARDQLSRLVTVEQIGRQAEVVETRWKQLEAESREWADASSIANRLRQKALAHERDSRSLGPKVSTLRATDKKAMCGVMCSAGASSSWHCKPFARR